MRGRDFLDIVVQLESIGGEASLRTRIGRIYYAAYLECRTYCEVQLGYDRSQTGREHAEVPRLLQQLDPEFAPRLKFLRQFRNIADYDMDISEGTLARQEITAFEYSRAVISRLDDLLREAQSRESDEPVDGEPVDK